MKKTRSTHTSRPQTMGLHEINDVIRQNNLISVNVDRTRHKHAEGRALRLRVCVGLAVVTKEGPPGAIQNLGVLGSQPMNSERRHSDDFANEKLATNTAVLQLAAFWVKQRVLAKTCSTTLSLKGQSTPNRFVFGLRWLAVRPCRQNNTRTRCKPVCQASQAGMQTSPARSKGPSTPNGKRADTSRCKAR